MWGARGPGPGGPALNPPLIVPDDWKQAKIIPLYKSGRKDDPSNYRPISILSVISKIVERAMMVQFQQYSFEHKLLSLYQSGFRKNYSTQLALAYFCDSIRQNVNNGLLTGAVFVDLKKAFDTISHVGLLRKLYRYGVRDWPLSWFRNYLSNRTQAVCIDCTVSLLCWKSRVGCHKALLWAQYYFHYLLTIFQFVLIIRKYYFMRMIQLSIFSKICWWYGNVSYSRSKLYLSLVRR